MKPVTAAVGPLLAAAALLLSGCGSSAPNDAEQFVIDFYTAGRQGDWATVCAGLDPEVVQALGGRQKCTRSLEENESAGGREVIGNLPERLDVTGSTFSQDGSQAVVTVNDKDGREQEIRVVRIDGTWHVTG